MLLYLLTNPELGRYQRFGLIALRSLTLGLFAAFLLHPVIHFINRYHERPVVVFLRDSSSSMDLTVNNKSKSSLLAESRRQLIDAYDKAGYEVMEQSFADGLDGRNTTTYLIPTLEKLKEKFPRKPIQEVLLFSDGWFRDQDMQLLKNLNWPVTAVSDTSTEIAPDLEISDFRHNRQGYRNELSLFSIDVKARDFKGQAKVDLLVEGKIAASKTVAFNKDPSQQVLLDYRFRQNGLQKVEARISAQGLNEFSLTNNIQTSAIDILTDKEQILLLTDATNWDSKFILDTIRENNRLEAINLIIKNNTLYQGDQRTSIKSWDNIASIIIVNNGSLQIDNQLASQITDKVRHNYGLLYLGLPVQSLNQILPLKKSNLSSQYKGLLNLQPVAAGYSALQIPSGELAKIPPLDYYYLTPTAGAEILAVMDNAQKSPAIGYSNAAGGRIISFAFLNLWRWQMQSKEQGYKSFIRNLLLWLNNKASGQLSALHESSYYQDEPIEIKLAAVDEIRQSKANASYQIVISDASKKAVLSDYLVESDSQYGISFRLNKPGSYSFRITDKSSGAGTEGRFIIQSQNKEALDFGFNNNLLKWIASETGGKFVEPGAAKTYTPLKPTRTERVEQIEFPLYKKWYLISLFILSFCLELYLRRRWGLL